MRTFFTEKTKYRICITPDLLPVQECEHENRLTGISVEVKSSAHFFHGKNIV